MRWPTFFLVWLAAGAAAAKGRYPHPETPISYTPSAFTRPALAAAAKRKPDLSASDVFTGMGESLKMVTDSQLKVLSRLIEVTPDSDPEKPDLLFRRAELYAEQERYFNFKARELDERIADARQFRRADKAAELEAQQTEYARKDKEWLLQAVKQYIEVANGPAYQSYQKMDQVLFYLAYLLTQVKQEDQARVFFKRLLKDYPQSPFLPHAYLSFAEYFFENRDLENALAFYEKALRFPNSPIYGYALYKKAWVYYNLADFKAAMNGFIAVVEWATAPARSSKGDAQLAKEAKKDIARTYSQLGPADKAWPFFQKHGRDYAPVMLEQLADLYWEQGNYADANRVHEQLIGLFPDSDKLCAWSFKSIQTRLALTGGRATAATVIELERLAAAYDAYKDRSDAKKELKDECRDETAGMLRELSNLWHAEAQKTLNRETYQMAAGVYKEYLQAFFMEPDAAKMRLQYADALFKLGDLDAKDASPRYCEAAWQFGASRVREAAGPAVIAWKNCLDLGDGEDSPARLRALAKLAKKHNLDQSLEQLSAIPGVAGDVTLAPDLARLRAIAAAAAPAP